MRAKPVWAELAQAAMWDEDGKVRKLLKAGLSVDEPDPWGSTPLHHVSGADAQVVCAYLLQRRADVNARSKFALSPLHHAASEGHVSIAKMLLAARADVNAGDMYWMTALHSAACAGHVEMARFLLDAGANSTCENRNGRIPLDVAREKQRTVIANCHSSFWLRGLILERLKAVVEILEEEQREREMLAAAEQGAMERVERLAREGTALSNLHSPAWQRPEVLCALQKGVWQRLQPAAKEALANALEGQVATPLQEVVLEYASPVGWDQLRDVMAVQQKKDERGKEGKENRLLSCANIGRGARPTAGFLMAAQSVKANQTTGKKTVPTKNLNGRATNENKKEF
eukprot:g46478.t1